jgi:beta-N-acetylhexosaminidase
MQLPLTVLCGQLMVGGFHGTMLPSRYARALAEGRRGGAILFKRNIGDEIGDVAALNVALRDAGNPDMPALIGIDQEGGRVARIGPPALVLPPMRVLGASGDHALVRRVARTQALELAALGFTMNFAPVLDIDTRAQNPVIGDRAFGDDPQNVARLGVAFAAGIDDGGLLACGKHFPGHGDTTSDSHIERPVVAHARARLNAVELVPFVAAANAEIAALMTAHVTYPALDPHAPATLSRAICTKLLRGELGYEGVLVSDDLEMGAIRGALSVEDAAMQAIHAGCDMLLVGEDEDAQDRVHEALVRRAESDSRFRERCAQAAERVLRMRRKRPPHPIDDPSALDAIVGSDASQWVTAELDMLTGHREP